MHLYAGIYIQIYMDIAYIYASICIDIHTNILGHTYIYASICRDNSIQDILDTHYNYIDIYVCRDIHTNILVTYIHAYVRTDERTLTTTYTYKHMYDT